MNDVCIGGGDVMGIQRPTPAWEEARAIAGARARAYALLALAFRPPADGLLFALLDEGRAWSAAVDLCPDPELVRSSRTCVEFAHALVRTQGTEGALREMEVTYTRLFEGPRPAAPPYGSLYLEGCLMGTSTIAAVESYRRAGLAPVEDLHDLPDHAAAEFEFLCELLHREGGAWAAGDPRAAEHWLQQEDAFLTEHLCRWFPLFARRVEEAPDPHPFADLTAFGRAFLAFDRQLIATCREMARLPWPLASEVQPALGETGP